MTIISPCEIGITPYLPSLLRKIHNDLNRQKRFMSVISLLLGGLGLFLHAIFRLSRLLEETFGKRTQLLLRKYTSNIWQSIFIGTIVTILAGSSTAVIIMAILLINSKILTFRHVLGIILGANIGTTFSSQLLALDIGQFSFILILIGLIFSAWNRSDRMKKFGSTLLYFGILFFGLFIMQQAVIPIKESQTIKDWLSSLGDNPLKGAAMGGLVTLLVQSSSATVGLAIILGKEKIISASTGIALMIGAELGTCSDSLLATIGGSKQALKAGVFHLIFNLITVILGLLLFDPFHQLVMAISTDAALENTIANAHMIFNVLGVVAILPFIGLMERFLDKIIKENKQ